MVSKSNLSLNDTFARCILFSSKLYITFLRIAMFIDIEMIIVRKICHSVQSNAILNVVHPVAQT